MGEIPRQPDMEDSPPQADGAVKNDQRIRYDENEGLILVDGKTVQLSKPESRIFAALYNEPGKLLSRDKITLQAYGTTYMSRKLVDVHLSNIRKKIRNANPGLKPLKSVRGFGYKYVGAEEISPPSSDTV